ncbi:hypothetical protein STRIP9103_06366 [Streptomyces ipomoeae 91-03]|uniref:Uncharacterized protein n=1 Tax=Streptomyces ipomoeae 91-03 TaxID=698759 RepID=L1KQ25_9ACTN|nr:hypothetical protein STRIP9103_06366 [Streptomyces ipomoeae 91-03]
MLPPLLCHTLPRCRVHTYSYSYYAAAKATALQPAVRRCDDRTHV